MSRAAQVFRSISLPFASNYDLTGSDHDDNVASSIDNFSDNKTLEMQLSESVKINNNKADELNAVYQRAVGDIEYRVANELAKLQHMLNDPLFAGLKDHITSLIDLIETTKRKQLDTLKDNFRNNLTLLDEENKKLTQSIYQQNTVETLMQKIENPSFDFELGLAIGILLHNDRQYCPEDDNMLNSSALLRRYFTKLALTSDVHTPKLFEEHIISHAKSVLLNTLSNRSALLGSHNYIVKQKPDSQGIKLTDTNIHQNFIFGKE